MMMIFHITLRSQWEAAQPSGFYHADSLETEGFIHCSTAAQVARSANKFYQGQVNLLLLGIDPSLLQAELRYDTLETGEAFPHIYGAINLDAVTQVMALKPDDTGHFVYP
jgi:uncharacterized protein (DUF952 family)